MITTSRPKTVNNLTLQMLIDACPQRLKAVFNAYLSAIPSDDLKNSMDYTLQNGGKYLRPLLIYATGLTFNAHLENLDIPAAAVELIHTYSLIHDDLPCMDNADLRRGRPTCHKIYNEGMAVLTGDALHTLAMQIISSHPADLSDTKRVAMMKTLSTACGPFGMAAGQALDITKLHQVDITTEMLLHIYHLKTGALFTACLILGWHASNDQDGAHFAALKQFGDLIGTAFQIQDDVVDIETATAESGKPQGIDDINQKSTYPKIHGLTDAKAKVNHLYHQALQSIEGLGEAAYLLRDIAAMMLRRTY